jgi:hypothetical protein
MAGGVGFGLRFLPSESSKFFLSTVGIGRFGSVGGAVSAIGSTTVGVTIITSSVVEWFTFLDLNR